jgi:uncharacterized membrane protein HdeD (DUF308 family)
MLEALSRYWWAVALRGAAAVIFGILALIWPGITLYALVILFGAYALVDGIMALGSAIFGDRERGRRGWLIFEGIAGIAAGILTFLWPGITALVLLWLIAGWAIVTGVLEIVAAIRLRREIQGEWMLAVSGVLSVLFGVLLLAWPAVGALSLVLLIGIYAIVFGVVLIALGLRLRRVHQETGTVPGTHRPATA